MKTYWMKVTIPVEAKSVKEATELFWASLMESIENKYKLKVEVDGVELTEVEATRIINR